MTRDYDISARRDGAEHREWTRAEGEELVRLWDEGMPASQIGKALNRSKNSVLGKARRWSLTPRAVRGGWR